MIEKLRQLKKKSHMTNQQIAEKSNIPESTVARIFSGKTQNPTITTVISMARAMGSSAADLLSEDDIKNTENDSVNDEASDPEFMKSDGDTEDASADNTKSSFDSGDRSSDAAESGKDESEKETNSSENIDQQEKMYEDIINLYRNEMKKKDVWISRLFWCIAIFILFILFVLIFDILNPGFGFVKY